MNAPTGIPDWLRDHIAANAAAANAELRAKGDCFGSGLSGHPRRAEYVWHTQIGNEIPLCGPCCALWRQNAAEDPALAPARVADLEAS